MDITSLNIVKKINDQVFIVKDKNKTEVIFKKIKNKSNAKTSEEIKRMILEQFQKSILNEIKIMKLLKNEHKVTKILEIVNEKEKIIGFTMKKYINGSLKEFTQKHKFDYLQKLSWCIQII